MPWPTVLDSIYECIADPKGHEAQIYAGSLADIKKFTISTWRAVAEEVQNFKITLRSIYERTTRYLKPDALCKLQTSNGSKPCRSVFLAVYMLLRYK